MIELNSVCWWCVLLFGALGWVLFVWSLCNSKLAELIERAEVLEEYLDAETSFRLRLQRDNEELNKQLQISHQDLADIQQRAQRLVDSVQTAKKK